MNRDELNLLLAQYATGGLNDDQRKQLFAAALEDQELFDALMEEDALREVMELPGAKQRLIAALDPAPPAARQRPLWLAWATGLAVVFLSAGITYVLLDRQSEVPQQVANAVFPSNKPAPKPFTPPEAAAAARRDAAQPPVPEAPPQVAMNRPSLPAPPISNPVLALPPPPKAEPVVVAEARTEKAREEKVRDQLEPAKELSKDTKADASSFRAAQNQVQRPAPSATQQAAGGGVAQGVVGGVISAAAPMAAKRKVAEALTVSVWRSSAEGVWTRLNAGEAVDRGTPLAIRVTAPDTEPVVLIGANGRALQTQSAAIAGDELEFRLPVATVRGVRGAVLMLTVRGRAISIPLR